MPHIIAYSAMLCPWSSRQVLTGGRSLFPPLELGIENARLVLHTASSPRFFNYRHSWLNRNSTNVGYVRLRCD
jgi:hypothetical protein